MNGIEALTDFAVLHMVDVDAELLFDILDEYKQLDRDYWTAQSQINALETELDQYHRHEGFVYIFPRWIRKYLPGMDE